MTELTDWGRSHTGPNDANSPHDILVKAMAVLEKATGTGQPVQKHFTVVGYYGDCGLNYTGWIHADDPDHAMRLILSLNDQVTIVGVFAGQQTEVSGNEYGYTIGDAEEEFGPISKCECGRMAHECKTHDGGDEHGDK